MSKKKCECKHLGHCPFSPLNPLAQTYLDGTKVFRPLTDDEQRKSRVSIVIGGEVQLLSTPLAGDNLARDTEGAITVAARAIEPERTVEYARARLECKCKGDSFIWKKTHPVPKGDFVVTAKQVPEVTF
jgi:hypothetical protein